MPDADRQAVAERSRAEVGAGDLAHVRVIAERAVQARVVVEERLREEADVGEDRIQADRGVALAEDEAVAVGPARLVRPVLQARA